MWLEFARHSRLSPIRYAILLSLTSPRMDAAGGPYGSCCRGGNYRTFESKLITAVFTCGIEAKVHRFNRTRQLHRMRNRNKTITLCQSNRWLSIRLHNSSHTTYAYLTCCCRRRQWIYVCRGSILALYLLWKPSKCSVKGAVESVRWNACQFELV